MKGENRNHLQLLEIQFLLVELGLRIWEKKLDDSLQRYSYYWIDELDNQIIGWDNAPHHPDIETFPDHKHVGGKSLASRDKLVDIFKYIANRLK